MREVTEHDGYIEITAEVRFHADQNTATITLTNLKDADWNTAPKAYLNNHEI